MFNNRKKVKAADVQESRFYQLPKFLIHDPEFKGMSNDAKVLYSIMRDRHELSLSNNWVDDDGYVYMIYSRQNMMDDLQMSDKSITKTVKELRKYGLIDEKRQGCNKPNLIYVLTLDLDSQWNRKNYESETVKNTYPNKEMLRPNDTNTNDTEIKETEIIKQQQPVVVVDDYVISEYQRYFEKKPTKPILKKLASYLQRFEQDAVTYAFDIAFNKAKDFDYVIGILKNWTSEGKFTFDEVVDGENSFI